MAVWDAPAAGFAARSADEGVPKVYVEEAERTIGRPGAFRADILKRETLWAIIGSVVYEGFYGGLDSSSGGISAGESSPGVGPSVADARPGCGESLIL